VGAGGHDFGCDTCNRLAGDHEMRDARIAKVGDISGGKREGVIDRPSHRTAARGRGYPWPGQVRSNDCRDLGASVTVLITSGFGAGVRGQEGGNRPSKGANLYRML
jgi:hypothetical protein